MGLFKALKLEIMILTPADLSDEDVIKWTEEALLNYAEFDEVIVKIKEKHERIIHEMDASAEA